MLPVIFNYSLVSLWVINWWCTVLLHKPENIHKMKLPLIHSLITLCLFRKGKIKAWVFPFIYQFPKLFVASPASFKQARRPMSSFLKYFYHYEPVDLNIYNVFPCSCYYYRCSCCSLARETSSNGLQCLSNFTPVIFDSFHAWASPTWPVKWLYVG